MVAPSVFEEMWLKLCTNFCKSDSLAQQRLLNRQQDFFWKEMQHWQHSEFVWVCETILQNDDHFPRLVDFNSTRRQWQDKHERETRVGYQECDLCDGYGTIYVDGQLFRGRCIHGQQFERSFKEAPEGITKALASRIWLKKHHSGVRFGLDYLDAFSLSMPEDVRDSVEMRLQEMEAEDDGVL